MDDTREARAREWLDSSRGPYDFGGRGSSAREAISDALADFAETEVARCRIALLYFVIIPKLQEVAGMAVQQLDKVLR